MPTKKDGTKATWKEFFQDAAKGMRMEGLSQAQIHQSMEFGFALNIIGYVIAIIWCVFILNLYWLILIFIAGLWINLTQYIANNQKKKMFMGFERLERESSQENKIPEEIEE